MSDEAVRRFEGVSVPEPDYANDDGSIDPQLERVLKAYDDGSASLRDVVAVLAHARLMTPLVAVLDEAESSPDGLRQEKSSHLASVSLVSGDGRRGLLAFTCVESMTRWDPDARGIPASAARVASGALDEGADALLLDLGGPVRVAVSGTALRCLASGAPLPPVLSDPEVGSAVIAALTGLEGLAGILLEPPLGPADDSAPDLLVLVEPELGVDLEDLARRVAERLVTDPVVAALCPRGVAVGAGPSASG